VGEALATARVSFVPNKKAAEAQEENGEFGERLKILSVLGGHKP